MSTHPPVAAHEHQFIARPHDFPVCSVCTRTMASILGQALAEVETWKFQADFYKSQYQQLEAKHYAALAEVQ